MIIAHKHRDSLANSESNCLTATNLGTVLFSYSDLKEIVKLDSYLITYSKRYNSTQKS